MRCISSTSVRPDLLFGFDSDVTKRNIVGVAMEHPEPPSAVCCCKFGQESRHGRQAGA